MHLTARRGSREDREDANRERGWDGTDPYSMVWDGAMAPQRFRDSFVPTERREAFNRGRRRADYQRAFDRYLSNRSFSRDDEARSAGPDDGRGCGRRRGLPCADSASARDPP